MTAAMAARGEGDFRAGAVIGRSFDVLRRHFLKFMALAFAMWLPSLLILFSGVKPGQQIARGQQVAPGQHLQAGTAGILILAALIWLFFFALCQPAIIYGAFQSMRGQDFQIGEAFGRALRRLLPVFGVVIIAGILMAIGFVLLVVPGIILWAMFYVAVPVCVVERLGPTRSLGRSRDLTKGYRWRIFGLGLLVGLLSAISLALEGILKVAFGGIAEIAGDGLLQVILMAFQLIVYAVAYHDMRVAKEGIDIEELASVFD